ncbi:MAG: MotA/TolQ/ExbB proton channel family protein [Halofilum sp. (in: g-proteobacteria)]|nr:MotA/TolQ/ExbB proton channel family protein [Halofilum sp. (in: g-proteobacteria)]
MEAFALIDPIVRFFQTGGAFMYPIVAVLALGIAIAIERYITLTRARRTSQKNWEEIRPMLEHGQFDEVYEFTGDADTHVNRLINLGLGRRASARRRDDIEIAMEEGMMEIIPQLEKRTHYLALFANIATLLGLLGTIMGLIEAFTAVSAANPAEKADLLSASISVAMNTTAFGLMAGIPLLLLHAYLSTKTSDLVDSLEMASVKTLNLITEFGKRDQPQATS